MKTEIVRATEVDVAAVAESMTERHKAEWHALLPDGVEARDVVIERFTDGVCARLGGEPVAVGEVFINRPGVASLGLVTTEAFPAAALAFTRFLRGGLFQGLKNEGVHRIECMTLTHFEAARRWMAMLGLEEEAVLRSYGRDREDFVQFAWVAS